MQLSPVCGNCRWMTVARSMGKIMFQFCDNEDSPRADDDVEQDDTCEMHEFKEDSDA